ncbi:selenocysteine-specific translation elongation factor [Brachybacterium phenoliresistens]|uniref:selenocysteine-specific translation elongation factor n=1 Tax=Brachybacterium phenoliresistens TaxID=396014 RepID=UPI0031CFEBAE
MRSHVVATAGHVDHGKSALVRALTGIEPDRWEEERRRGLTIDLGFAWTTLPSGRAVSFVDVPGHERFLGNMLAGLGPAPVVCFVVAADAGWQPQSSDHRDAIAALGIDRGLLVITRADLALGGTEAVIAQARRELAGTGLGEAPAVVTSAVDGTGLEELAQVLDRVLAEAEASDTDPGTGQEPVPLRLWIDRAFSISGAGTVATGTLGAGSIGRGDRLTLHTADGPREVQVRGVQGHGASQERMGPVSRVAVNLRGIPADAVRRGDALAAPGSWHLPRHVDVRRCSGASFDEAPREVTAHVGTAAVPGRLRIFDADHARLQLDRPLPLRVADRIVLRAGGRAVLAGAQVLDADPPALSRRGDGARRARALAAAPAEGDLLAEVLRRRAVQEAHLRRLGLTVPAALPEPLRGHRGWLVDAAALDAWAARVLESVMAGHRQDPLWEGMSPKAAEDLLGLPDAALLPAVLDEARRRDPQLRTEGGRIRRGEEGLGPAEPAVAALELRLGREPFRAPEAEELSAAGLHDPQIAAAVRQGRLLRLDGGVVLLPSAPALAMRELAALDQPFTLSAARQALGTTRRVAVPLLEHLDARGWTRRVDGSLREVVR